MQYDHSEVSKAALSHKGYTWLRKNITLMSKMIYIWTYVRIEENKISGKNAKDLSLDQFKFALFMYQRGTHWNNDGEASNADFDYMSMFYKEILSRDPKEDKLRMILK